jgi:serine/threonine protein kinase HipA of HipAB toxin-antitoxin module
MPRRTLAGLGVAVLLLLAGCASGDDTASPGGGSTASDGPGAQGSAGGEQATGNDAAPVVEITVSVRDGTVNPKTHRVDVKQGSTVRLQVTSDVDDVLHVHGFDVEEPLEAGRTTMVELTADQPGVFEVETHESDLELLQLEVR